MAIASAIYDTYASAAAAVENVKAAGVPEQDISMMSNDATTDRTGYDTYRPDGLRMVGEYWAGWFDKWGEEHHETDGKKEAEEMAYMLKRGYSISLYMVHGGSHLRLDERRGFAHRQGLSPRHNQL